MESASLNKSHWRKSGQWFALQRRHAELVVADTEVAEAFKQCVPPNMRRLSTPFIIHAFIADNAPPAIFSIWCSRLCVNVHAEVCGPDSPPPSRPKPGLAACLG